MSYHLIRVIGTPEQAHSVHSEAAYLDHARRFLLRLGIPPARLREIAGPSYAYVSGGRWLVTCACGNAPSAHPGGSEGWPRPIAVCLECGAIYRPIFPADLAEAEAALLMRPDPETRHFFPRAGQAAWVGEDAVQTVDDLKRENKERAADIERDRVRFPQFEPGEAS